MSVRERLPRRDEPTLHPNQIQDIIMDKLLENRFQMLLPEGHLVDLVQDCNKYDGKPLSKS